MNVKDIGEFGLIDRLTKFLPIKDENVIVGYGDDCACVKVGNNLLLLTIDIQVENVHFIKEKVDPIDLGWKLSTSNVSDVVACGGKPKWALISLGLPKDTDIDFIEKIYFGIKEAQEYYGFYTIGGNCSSSKEILIDMALIGESDVFISRSGSKQNQYVYLSGPLGCSKAGLELLLMDKVEYEDFEKELIKKHTKPIARVDLVDIIKQSYACIDISDGLSSDLYHVSKQSNVKIVLEKEKLPIDENLKKFCLKYNKNPLDYILTSGEEYQIVLISDKELPLFKIGYTEEGFGLYLDSEPIKERGFNHFK